MGTGFARGHIYSQEYWKHKQKKYGKYNRIRKPKTSRNHKNRENPLTNKITMYHNNCLFYNFHSMNTPDNNVLRAKEADTKGLPLSVKLALGATAIAVVSACGGGGDNAEDPSEPVTPPETPPATEVLPSATADIGALGASGKSIADILKEFDGRITAIHVTRPTANNLTNCSVAPNADGGYTLIITPTLGDAQIREGVEESDNCELQGAGDGVEHKLTVAQFLDTIAPQLISATATVFVDTAQTPEAKLADLFRSGKDEKLFFDIDANDLKANGYRFNKEEGVLSWENWVSTKKFNINVTDEAGNLTIATIIVTKNSSGEGEINPPTPPPEETCQGNVDMFGNCIS
jgi:hypothetical protein